MLVFIEMAFYGDLNVNPHAYKANTLPTELYLQPIELLYCTMQSMLPGKQVSRQEVGEEVYVVETKYQKSDRGMGQPAVSKDCTTRPRPDRA